MSEWPLMILMVMMTAMVVAAFLIGLVAGYRLSNYQTPLPRLTEMISPQAAPSPAPNEPDPDAEPVEYPDHPPLFHQYNPNPLKG